MRWFAEVSLADYLISAVLLTLLVLPILRLQSLDTFSFTSNIETIRAVRLAQEVMEQVLSSDRPEGFAKGFKPINFENSRFEYKVIIRPASPPLHHLREIGISVRWGQFFKSYHDLYCQKFFPPGPERG